MLPHAQSARGFTLIETMVAVTILALAVAGPLLAASRAIVAAQTADAQITASYLAQEGIEYVRQVRDNAYLAAYAANSSQLSATAWQNFLTGAMSSCLSSSNASQRCVVDPLESPNVAGCLAGSCPALHWNGSVYTQQATGTLTPYTRSIELRSVPTSAVDANGNHVELQVLSTVSWSLHGTPYSIVVSDELTEWQ